MKTIFRLLTAAVVPPLVAVLIAHSMAPVALAQELPAGDKLQLGPHTFAHNGIVDAPFILSHFRNSLGVGVGFDVETQRIQIDTIAVVGLEGDLLFATLDFEFQQAVNPWLAFSARLEVLGRLGTGIQSLLSQGITAGAGFELGGRARLYEGEKLYVSGRLKYAHGKGTVVDLFEFVQGIVDSGRVTEAHPLVDNTSINSGAATVSVAWSVSRLFGLSGEVGGGAGKSTRTDTKTRGFYNAGAAASIDLRALDFIPAGISAGFSQATIPRGGGGIADISRTAFLSIGYNGRPDYFLGLEFTTRWLPSSLTDQTIRAGSVLVTSKYMF